MGFIRVVLLLLIALAGSLYLETALRVHYVLELYLLLLAAITAIVVLVAVAWRLHWGWPLASILFSLIALNAVVVFLATRTSTLTFFAVLLVSLAGILLSWSRSEPEEPIEQLIPARTPKPKGVKANKKRKR